MGPRKTLSGIAQQVHDDCALLDRLINIKEVRSRYPSILLCIFPALAVLPHANDNIKTVVAKVQALAVALRAVANEGKSVVLEVVL